MKIYSVLSFTAVKFSSYWATACCFSQFIDSRSITFPQLDHFQEESRFLYKQRKYQLVVADCELPTREHGTLFLPTLGTVLANQNWSGIWNLLPFFCWESRAPFTWSAGPAQPHLHQIYLAFKSLLRWSTFFARPQYSILPFALPRGIDSYSGQQCGALPFVDGTNCYRIEALEKKKRLWLKWYVMLFLFYTTYCPRERPADSSVCDFSGRGMWQTEASCPAS
jgi:hypothetical protein